MKKLLLILSLFSASVYTEPNAGSNTEEFIVSKVEQIGTSASQVQNLFNDANDTWISAFQCLNQVKSPKGKNQAAKLKHALEFVYYPRLKDALSAFDAIALQINSLHEKSEAQILLAVAVIEGELESLKKKLENIRQEVKAVLVQAQAVR
jgi:hypothetical protein